MLYIVAGLGHLPECGPGWSAAGAWFREGKAGQTWPEEEAEGTPARTHPQLSPGQLSCGTPAALGSKKSLRPRPALITFQRTRERSCARQDSGSPQTTLIPERPSFPPPNFTHGTPWPRRRQGLAQGQLPDLPTLRRFRQALELSGAWPSLWPRPLQRAAGISASPRSLPPGLSSSSCPLPPGAALSRRHLTDGAEQRTNRISQPCHSCPRPLQPSEDELVLPLLPPSDHQP